ncbi:hypothetical protein COOONC_19811 [Cooperia oncophora]
MPSTKTTEKASYVNMSFFLLMTGMKGFHFGKQGRSVQDGKHFETQFKVLVSLCLHSVAALCVLVCIGIYYGNKKLTSTVLVAVLAFVFFFNFIGAVLLFVFDGRNNADQTALKDCAILSMGMAVFVVGIGIFFAKKPPSSGNHTRHRGPEIVPLQ